MAECVPAKACVEALTPRVMFLGDGGLWEVVRIR